MCVMLVYFNFFNKLTTLQIKHTRENRRTKCRQWSDKALPTRWDEKSALGSRSVAARRARDFNHPETGLPSYRTSTCKAAANGAVMSCRGLGARYLVATCKFFPVIRNTREDPAILFYQENIGLFLRSNIILDNRQDIPASTTIYNGAPSHVRYEGTFWIIRASECHLAEYISFKVGKSNRSIDFIR